jgi:hypothetical protein
MMGYHSGSCRSGFTMGQIERMHDRLEIWREQINNDFCDGTETGCIDSEACNYDSEAIYDDGSCEYANPGFDCEGNPVVSVQELYQRGDVKSYSYFDVRGRVIVNELPNISGIYMLVVEYFNGNRSVTKTYLEVR